MEKIKIELPVNDWNAVLGMLSQRRFDEVAGLIAEIKQQAAEQMNAAPAPAASQE